MARERFGGFPPRADCTAVPTLLLTRLMSEISDIAELKVTLHVIQAIYHKKGYPRFVTFNELVADSTLVAGLGLNEPHAVLRKAVDTALARGTLLSARLDRGGFQDEFLVINDDPGRKSLPRLACGGVKAPETAAPAMPVARPNIYTLYEQNIGLLTPIVADDLRAAEMEYPADWIEDAFREAVQLNKRNWRYISRILENWAISGRDSGKPWRYSKKQSSPEDHLKPFGRPAGR